MATQHQKDQLIAWIATMTDPSHWGETQRFQRTVFANPKGFAEKFAKMLRDQPDEPTEIIPPKLSRPYIINTARFPDPVFPDWSRERILTGVIIPKTINLNTLMELAWQHEGQIGENKPTGHELLARLVSDYVVGQDSVGKTYQVKLTDQINLHHGFKSLSILADKWKKLPKSFRVWADGKILYGLADAIRGGNGYLNVSCLKCSVPTSYVFWCNLGSRWYGSGFALREAS